MLILVYPDERPGEASGQGISGFLRQLNKAVPAGSGLHVIPDNSGTHKTAAVVPWPTVHPRDLLHLTPTVHSNCKCTGEGLVKKLSGSLVV